MVGQNLSHSVNLWHYAQNGARMTEKNWKEIDHDPVSDRRIFKADDSDEGKYYGGYDFKVAADFEVRDANGDVLMTSSGSAKGEYWCGVFLWFVKGSNGRKVRLDESDRDEDEFYDVPDHPLQTRTPPP